MCFSDGARGGCDRAMVPCNLQCRGVLPTAGKGPTVLAVTAGGSCVDDILFPAH